MLKFVYGFIVALLVAAPAVWLILRKKLSKAQKSTNGHLKQLEELSKLTGALAHEIKNPLSTIKINLKLVGEELEDSNANAPASKGIQTPTRALRKIAVIQKEMDQT